MSVGRDEAEVGETGSYKNSWQRYAVLTVLLAVMGVLGYLLYEKRMNPPAVAAPGDDNPDGLPLDNFKVVPGPNAGPPLKMVSAGASTGGAKAEVPAPKKGRSMDELRKNLVGKWENKTGDVTATVEYKDDGTFMYTASDSAIPVIGRWAIKEPEARGTGPTIEWTVFDQTIPPASLALRGDKLEKHPLLHRRDDSGTFERK
jgi:hypothetical protein